MGKFKAKLHPALRGLKSGSTLSNNLHITELHYSLLYEVTFLCTHHQRVLAAFMDIS